MRSGLQLQSITHARLAEETLLAAFHLAAWHAACIKIHVAKHEQPKSYLGLPTGTMNAATAERARKILRELWHQRSWQKKAALARATDAEGFQVCESCKRRAPKVHVDHIVKCGEPDAQFLQRLFIDPALLRVLCVPCHADKTWCERLDLFAHAAKRESKPRKPRVKKSTGRNRL